MDHPPYGRPVPPRRPTPPRPGPPPADDTLGWDIPPAPPRPDPSDGLWPGTRPGTPPPHPDPRTVPGAPYGPGPLSGDPVAGDPVAFPTAPEGAPPRSAPLSGQPGTVSGPPPAGPPSADDADEPTPPGHRRTLENRWRRRVGTLVAVLAALGALAIVGHRFVPDVMGVGSLLDTVLPWLGVPVAVLAVVAAISRTWRSAIAVTAAVAAWAVLFVPPMVHSGPGGVPDLRLVSHNVSESNSDPAGTARALLAANADVVVLQEVTGHFIDGAGPLLNARYPYHYYPGYQQSSPDQFPEFGVWSSLPLTQPQLVQVAPGLVDALRITLTTKAGPVELYDVHLVSPSLNHTGYAHTRDTAIDGFDRVMSGDHTARVILSGDFNTAATDRKFGPLAGSFADAQIHAGSGLGFTYPSSFPVVAIDHVLSRGLTPLDAGVLPRTASDHRPVFANLRFG